MKYKKAHIVSFLIIAKKLINHILFFVRVKKKIKKIFLVNEQIQT